MFTSAYTPNSKQIEDYFSPDRDFALRPQGADFRYVLCSSPRSGSTLIASMLHATGRAGDPLEYLNDQWIRVFMRTNPGPPDNFDVGSYLAGWEARRTSPNGIFGIKLHYHQMRRTWRGREREAVDRLGSYDRHILLVRRDKIAQAVSLYRAIASQMWTSKDVSHVDAGNSAKKREVDFNPVRIAELLAFLIKEEEGWRSFLRANNIPFAESIYENFVSDYAAESVKLLELLGMDSKAEDIPPPQLSRQSQGADPLIEQFRRHIGLAPQSCAA